MRISSTHTMLGRHGYPPVIPARKRWIQVRDPSLVKEDTQCQPLASICIYTHEHLHTRTHTRVDMYTCTKINRKKNEMNLVQM